MTAQIFLRLAVLCDITTGRQAAFSKKLFSAIFQLPWVTQHVTQQGDDMFSWWVPDASPAMVGLFGNIVCCTLIRSVHYTVCNKWLKNNAREYKNNHVEDELFLTSGSAQDQSTWSSPEMSLLIQPWQRTGTTCSQGDIKQAGISLNANKTVCKTSEPMMRKSSSCVALAPCCLRETTDGSADAFWNEKRGRTFLENQSLSGLLCRLKEALKSVLKFLQIFYFSCGKTNIWVACFSPPCCWLDLAFDPQRANDNPRL